MASLPGSIPLPTRGRAVTPPLVVTFEKVDGVHSRPHRIDVNAYIEGV